MRNCNDEIREITNEIEIALSFLMSVNAQIKRCISPIGEKGFNQDDVLLERAYSRIDDAMYLISRACVEDLNEILKGER